MRMKLRAISMIVLMVSAWLPYFSMNAGASTIPSSNVDQQVLEYVNPMIGTTGVGDTFPGATAPFGMVQWSPVEASTTNGSGFDANKHTITGFSLNHLSGAGCGVYGNFSFIPYAGIISRTPSSSPQTYAMPFLHRNEVAEPGYYRVLLSNGVKVQLTATTRTGYGQFHFDQGQPASILIDAGASLNSHGNQSDHVQIIGNDEVEGTVTANAGEFCGQGSGYTVHFAAIFSSPFITSGTWQGNTLMPMQAFAQGTQTGAYLTFAPGATVSVRVGLSYVSEANAWLNLMKEIPSGTSFTTIKHQTQRLWQQDLQQIIVSGGTSADKINFYTALYHAMLSPNTFSDVNGQYLGFDGVVHRALHHIQYANFSGWDIYRSQIPLVAFLMPKVASDMVQSLVDDGMQGGALPTWPLANTDTGLMGGDPADDIIASAYAMGAHSFNLKEALALMIKGSTVPKTSTQSVQERPGLTAYLAQGYIPATKGSFATTATLEYAMDDAAIGEFAKAIGQPASVYTPFLQRGQNWQNVFDPSTGLVQPRFDQGTWMVNDAPSTSTNFVEGSAYQYTWLVPQNYIGLSKVLGGEKETIKKLNAFFTQLDAGSESPYAWMGNEPSILTPYLYDFIGDPTDTERVVREIENQLYQPNPGGLNGNDDLGTMSAWYVWSTLGIYPVVPGDSGFAISSPLFTNEHIRFNDGKYQLHIQGFGASDSAPYIAKMQVNGQQQKSPWIPLSRLTEPNVSIKTWLSQTPQKTFATYLSKTSNQQAFSDQVGFQPILTSITPQQIVGHDGQTISFLANITNVDKRQAQYKVTIHSLWSPSAKIPISYQTLHAGSIRVFLTIPNNLAHGIYPFDVSFASSNASTSRPVDVIHSQLFVIQSSQDLFAYDNNIGISSDSNIETANFDGSQRSYSSNALRGAGWVPGYTFDAMGAHFVWPNLPSGIPDNMVCDGQTLPISGQGSHLVMIGASAGGNASGTIVIHYTNGQSQTEPFDFTDWTQKGGTGKLQDGNQVIVTTSYRNSVLASGKEIVPTYLFADEVAVTPSLAIQSITFPNKTGIHIFMLGLS